jgi:hypothetical protein
MNGVAPEIETAVAAARWSIGARYNAGTLTNAGWPTIVQAASQPHGRNTVQALSMTVLCFRRNDCVAFAERAGVTPEAEHRSAFRK